MEDKHIIIKLKELREDQDISQAELAGKLGVSRQSIIALEQGRFFPSLPLAVDLCNFFEKTFEDIFDFERPTECQIQTDENQPKISINKGKENAMTGVLKPWRPFREALSLREAVDQLMEDSFVSPRTALAAMRINLLEKSDKLIVKAELPGVDEENVDIEVGDDVITISGERSDEKETKEDDYYHKETHFGSFSRSIALPSPVIGDKAEAEMKNGILTVTIPKVAEKKASKVKVKKVEKK